MLDIYLLIDGKHAGPFTEEHIRNALAQGELSPELPAWHDGGTDWHRLGSLFAGGQQPQPASSSDDDEGAPGLPALVQVVGVTKTFGTKTALSDLSFTVPSGQICGLLGPNGAGKTTLFRLLMGVLKATKGSLRIGEHDAFEDRVEVKRMIGFLPDEPIFYSYLSGREVLELSASMHGMDAAATMRRISPLIAKLGMAEDIRNYAEDYSRGMKKKLGLLLAMLHQPRLLVLDEPTNGLDVESTHLFYDLILEESRRGTTVLFSTHLMDHVTRLCSHAVIINKGALIAKGSLGHLRSSFGQASLEEVFLQLTSRTAQQ